MSMTTSINQSIDRLQQRLDSLSARDRFALIALTIFLLVVGIGYSVWAVHQAGERAQLRATEERDLLLWMRSQAPNIRQNSTEQVPLNLIIQTTAQNQGLTVAQLPSGDQVQVSVTHPSFAVLGSWLSRMAEQGVSISQLDIRQTSSGELELKAMLGQA